MHYGKTAAAGYNRRRSATMPSEPATPPFPSRELLARFFRTPPGALVPLAEVAALLGITRRKLWALLRAEGAHTAGGAIPWSEAAAYLFDAWPRARILDALGASAEDVIPEQFRLMRVEWAIPVFIVRAMEHQAASGRRGASALRERTVSDYVTDVLYNEIDPATVRAFRGDSAFLRALHYPVVD
jgi:hypothetical protein